MSQTNRGGITLRFRVSDEVWKALKYQAEITHCPAAEDSNGRMHAEIPPVSAETIAAELLEVAVLESTKRKLGMELGDFTIKPEEFNGK